MTRGCGGAGGERDPAPSAIVPERRYITVRTYVRIKSCVKKKRYSIDPKFPLKSRSRFEQVSFFFCWLAVAQVQHFLCCNSILMLGLVLF